MEKDRQEATREVRRKKKENKDLWYDDLDDDDVSTPRPRKKKPRPPQDDGREPGQEAEPQPERRRRAEAGDTDAPKRRPRRRAEDSDTDMPDTGDPEERPHSGAPSRRQAHAKQLRRQRSLQFFKRLLICAAILGVLVLLFIFLFRIKNVDMQGNTRYSKEEILELLHYDEQSHNTILFYLQNRNLKVEGIPYIDDIHIEIGGRDTIDIEVVEKMIIGCIESQGQYVYFDTDGIICEIDSSRQTDVPLIDGLEFESLELNTELTVKDKSIYNALLSLTLLLKKHEITIDKVVFKDDGTMSMQMGDILVLLGNARNVEDKISELKNLLPQLEGLKGTLHLENYDSSKDSIIFSKE